MSQPQHPAVGRTPAGQQRRDSDLLFLPTRAVSRQTAVEEWRVNLRRRVGDARAASSHTAGRREQLARSRREERET